MCDVYHHCNYHYTAILRSLSNITLGEWNPLCSDKYLFKVTDNSTTYCNMQGWFMSSKLLVSIMHNFCVL